MIRIRKQFQKELKKLNSMLLRMNQAVKCNIDNMIKAIKTNDHELANKVVANDDVVDDLETEIETFCIDILISQQPVATDLRQVTAALKMTTDIERISDYCVSVCERFLKTKITSNSECVLKIIDLGRNAKQMLNCLIEGYMEQNDDKIIKVIEKDSISDKIYCELENFIAKNFEQIGTQNAINFVLIGRSLERMADHITNVCDWIHFKITGKFKI